MTAASRLRIAAIAATLALLAPAAPSLAQNSAGNSAETIGPEQLRNFSLGGNVTRPAEPSPAPARPAPEAGRTAAPPAADPPPAAIARQTDPSPATAGSATPRPDQPSRSVTMELPQAAPSDQPAATPGSPGPPLSSQPGLAPPVLPPVASVPVDDGPSLLPWLAAALGLGLAALYYASRKRPALSAPGAAADPAPVLDRTPGQARAAAPAAPAPAPAAAPAPRPAATGTTPGPAPQAGPSGLVSTRLRPMLALQLQPNQLVFDGRSAILRFAIEVANSGNAPARNVLVEAKMFNASPTQDQEIGAFFQHPVAQGERLAEIPAGRSVALASEVSIPADRMRVFELNGRKLFVPLIAFNALYEWIGGEGQTSASFMLGRQTGGEKMGPFHIELGPRIFRSVAAREQPLRVAR